jgi:DNA repair protein SbcC/Rad50
MRPLRLELKNFTAYRESQVLDLENLDLFAITGPTGSGKSSLLDAMTYALYGKAPRVGKAVSQLIAQGQPRLAVMLEFEVDGQRYRVTRETPAKGASSIRMERQAEGAWISAGDGADRINDANAMIERLVGLDYVGFTRSIVLPQGEFAEFLAGDPRDRRRILTELMDLGLFQRMAARAGEIARETRAAAQAKEEVLARQFAGVDEAAVKDARSRAKQAKARSEAMAEIERTLEGMARDSESLERRIETLDELNGEAIELAEAARAAAADLRTSLSSMEEAAAGVAAGERLAAEAEATAREAAVVVTRSEAEWGTLESLVALRAAVDQFASLEGRVAGAERSVSEARESIVAAEASRERTAAESADAAAALEQAERDVAAAEAEHERAHRADMVGALTRGKKVGDPCPVCERPLEEVHRVDGRELTRVRKALDRAREAASRAGARWSKAERDAAVADHEVQAARATVERTDRELEALAAERSLAGEHLGAAFGGTLPEHPVDEVDGRMRELRARRQLAEEAEAAAGRARSDATAMRDAAKELRAMGMALAGTLRGLPVTGLIKRARQCVATIEVPPGLVGALPSDPGPAAEAAEGLASGLTDLVERLGAAQRESRTGVAAILDRARALLPDGVPKAILTDLDDLLDAAHTAAKDLIADAAEARTEATRLAAQLKERAQLEGETRTLAADAAVFQALAAELRADRLITFLQSEALELLAVAGSERLLFLSQGRYRLAFEGDEFFVEDRQNGDERRSVRTLSGGETFLASLALALALSEQIQSLAVTHRARLQSLFIDEGFGNLDADVLEVAAEALTQLGGHDRMVGVITHVSELAERLPVRVEVRPLPGGSRLEVKA